MKVLAGLFLIPMCVAVTRTLVYLIDAIQPPSYTSVSLSAWAMLFGFALWMVLFFSLQRPVRTYVLAHELTHALWGVVMGAKVSRLKVSRSGGSVNLSKDNFLITLAPYFFPFYTVCVIVLYGLLSLFADLRTYEPFWLGLVGLTWGFHLTFTITTLMQHQTDIAAYGRVFSYTFIYFMNVLGICLWVVAVASPGFGVFLDRFVLDLEAVWGACWGPIRDSGGYLANQVKFFHKM